MALGPLAWSSGVIGFNPISTFISCCVPTRNRFTISRVVVAQRGFKIVDAALQTRKAKMPGAVRECLDASSLGWQPAHWPMVDR